MQKLLQNSVKTSCSRLDVIPSSSNCFYVSCLKNKDWILYYKEILDSTVIKKKICWSGAAKSVAYLYKSVSFVQSPLAAVADAKLLRPQNCDGSRMPKNAVKELLRRCG